MNKYFKIKIIIIILVVLLNIGLLIITNRTIETIKLFQSENLKISEQSQKFFKSYSELLNIKIDEYLTVYQSEGDSVLLRELVKESETYIYIDQNNCTKCLVELENIAIKRLPTLFLLETKSGIIGC